MTLTEADQILEKAQKDPQSVDDNEVFKAILLASRLAIWSHKRPRQNCGLPFGWTVIPDDPEEIGGQP